MKERMNRIDFFEIDAMEEKMNKRTKGGVFPL